MFQLDHLLLCEIKRYQKTITNRIRIQTVCEKVQQLLPNSTTSVSQVAHEQVQQQSELSSTSASQPIQEQMQQIPQNSSNIEGNNQSEEQGKHI
ncbi:hypothetical protein H5410_002539 [Solanum commersonii]|uniref:Uncharacterized protein n=1 Tax=Solanum commersonii TaxID=4109 RepID=A0A9J6B275_SOLCO|nr:hypothetical protein H5410_002539 [Solanum commersonii]